MVALLNGILKSIFLLICKDPNICMSLKVMLLGTGAGIPYQGRSQAGILIEDGMPLLLDCGAGTLMRLSQSGVSIESLDTVILTHLHLDHVSDLLSISNARYLQQLPCIHVYGPEGTRTWLMAQRSSFPYLEKMDIQVHEVNPMESFSIKGFDIFAESAKHSVNALAYRVEAESKVMVYSGDTETNFACSCAFRRGRSSHSRVLFS
jgi:ribonuclease BN (tRNA processing enzyme)